MSRPLTREEADGLFEYGNPSDTERSHVEDILKHGSARAAGIALGRSKTGFSEALVRLRKRAAHNGYAEGFWKENVPAGYRLGKVTNQVRNPDGTFRWDRLHPTAQHTQKEIEALASNAMSDVRGMSPLTPRPLIVSQSSLAAYFFGDPHFGLGSSEDDGGDNTDIDDADRLTRAGIDSLVTRMPATQRALLIFIGDNTHANDSSALTPAHRNPLDVDPRGFGAAFLSVSRAICYSVTRALEKHGEAECWILPGNHDPDAAFAIAVAVSFWFENNPRVTVKLSREYLWWTQFGKNLIAAHHGDKVKPMDMHGILSNDCKAVWGEVDYRYCFQGHIHHDTVTEYQQTRFESLRTLAKQDAWHRGKGFRSMRDTRAVVYHEKYGETERHTVSAAMLE